MQSLNTFFLLFLLLLLHKNLSSQVIFSQFYNTPLLVNPSNTGSLPGSYHFGGASRTEKDWQSQVNTIASFFFDTQILASATPENDKFSFGMAGISEKNVFSGIKNSYLLLSLAYHKALDENASHQLGIGFQLNLSHKQINPPPLVFEDQLRVWESTGFAGVSLSQTQSINITYPDFNFGLQYQFPVNAKNLVKTGLSVFHANHPDKAFNGGEFKLNPQGCVQLGLENTLNERAKFNGWLVLSRTFTDNQINDLIISCTYQSKINESNSYYGLGGTYRKNYLKGAAVIPTISMYSRRITLNISYDINISKSTVSQRGALEAGLIYTGIILRKK